MRLNAWFLVIAITGLLNQCAKVGRDTGNRDGEARCSNTFISVDSAYAVEQARRALGGFLSQDADLVPFRVEFVTHGVIVSLVSKHPTGTGGGGLVWIDRDNGCPTVLRH